MLVTKTRLRDRFVTKTRLRDCCRGDKLRSKKKKTGDDTLHYNNRRNTAADDVDARDVPLPAKLRTYPERRRIGRRQYQQFDSPPGAGVGAGVGCCGVSFVICAAMKRRHFLSFRLSSLDCCMYIDLIRK